MFNEKMVKLGRNRSVIRDLFEYGNELKKTIGTENVFDFTLGNPSVPTPEKVNETIISLIKTEPRLHAYTSAAGAENVKTAIADCQRKRYGLPVRSDLIYMTCGAAAGLAITLKAAITDDRDEVIVVPPFFPEYTVFIDNAGGKEIVLPLDENNFQINTGALEKSLSARTAAIILNSPNNPSGVVYTEETIKAVAAILKAAEQKFGTTIVLISDEPYREIRFVDDVPSPMNYYDDCVLCYSFSKSFSLPRENRICRRIRKTERRGRTFCGRCRRGKIARVRLRAALFQYAVAACCGEPSDVSVYRRNRDVLCDFFAGKGIKVANPEGAFYLMVAAPDGDGVRFSEHAKNSDY
ncbi:MAG: aminotransferase class I/II-fold pyridoxal phosphate-dependent enzyme [Christensenellales bacterium]